MIPFIKGMVVPQVTNHVGIATGLTTIENQRISSFLPLK
jgi:hypothetical protein